MFSEISYFSTKMDYFLLVFRKKFTFFGQTDFELKAGGGGCYSPHFQNGNESADLWLGWLGYLQFLNF